MTTKNLTEEERIARKKLQRNEAQKRYYQKNKEYYKNYYHEHIAVKRNGFKLRVEQAITCIEEFLCTEEYINLDGEAIANNYLQLYDILRGTKE